MSDNAWYWSDSGKTCTACGKWMTNGEVEEFSQCIECEAREWRAIKDRMGKEQIQEPARVKVEKCPLCGCQPTFTTDHDYFYCCGAQLLDVKSWNQYANGIERSE